MKHEFSFRLNKIKEYFFSLKMKEIAKLEKKGYKIINLGIGNPDMLPPTTVIKKIQETCTLPEANKYQSYIGIKELREEISKWYSYNYKVNINPKNEILPLMGSKEGIMHISMTFINQKDTVLIPDPGYPTYTSVSKILGANIIKYELKEDNNWQLDINEINNNYDTKNIKILWINYPHMPTGAIIKKTLLKNIVMFCIKNNIILVNDNPYSLINIKKPISIFQIKDAKKIALEINSLSKCYNMAGWRVGMVVGNELFIKNILKIKSQMDSGMYLPIQRSAIEALKTPQTWMKKLNQEYIKRKHEIIKICRILNMSYNKDNKGIFVWAKLPHSNNNDIKWCNNLLKKTHIFITPGSIFGKNGEGYVRISLCVNIQQIKKAIKRIKSHIKTLK